MSAKRRLGHIEECEAMLARRAAIFKEHWQNHLRAALDRYIEDRPQLQANRDQAYLFFLAELLRWARDEEGCDADHLAEAAAGMAEVFPQYGGQTI